MLSSRRRSWALLAILALLALALATRLLVESLSQEPPNYTLVAPGLYLGGRVDKPPPDARAVLNLRQQPDPYTAEISRWQPIPDGPPAPTLDWLRAQVEFIDAQRRSGRTVFVHCDAGVSRSPMVMAAYLMWRNHQTRENAIAQLRSRRPQVNPNATFMDLLAQWEKATPP